MATYLCDKNLIKGTLAEESHPEQMELFSFCFLERKVVVNNTVRTAHCLH